MPGGVTAAVGFSASGIAAGIKSASGRLDLACIFADRPSPWAATLTTNRFAAAPVKLARALLRQGGPLQAVLVNSGNANAATGPEGERRARKVAAAVAKVLELPAGRVLVSSTGIIGRPLPADRIVRAVPEAVRTLAPSGGGPRRAGDHDHGHVRQGGGAGAADRRPDGADRRDVQGRRDDPPEHGHDARLHHHRRRGPPGPAAAAAERRGRADLQPHQHRRRPEHERHRAADGRRGLRARASRPRVPTASASPRPSTRSAAGWPS